jgi:5'-nucleotidase
MNILVTNDDGIGSPGLWALAKAMSRVGQTLVVAPDKEQSGVGTSVSMHSGMDVVEVPSSIEGVRAYAIGGTPSDCVIMGLRRLAQGHIDLLVSGINLGPNVGNDIPYSGTVMATLQGYFRKIPSMAVSLVFQNRDEELRFDIASQVAESLALSIRNGDMQTDAILNVNVPNLPRHQIKGIVATKTASSGYVRLAEARGGTNIGYSTVIGRPAGKVIEEGTDIWAIDEGFISITPLRLEVTHYNLIPAIARYIQGLESDLLGTQTKNSEQI